MGEIATGQATETAERIVASADAVAEGGEYTLRVGAKDAQGFGIARLGNFVVFIKNAKTRIGNLYHVKVTKVYRTFAYADVAGPKTQVIGNGSVIRF
jgi:predicted RNA-binding protein with TRAM domain